MQTGSILYKLDGKSEILGEMLMTIVQVAKRPILDCHLIVLS